MVKFPPPGTVSLSLQRWLVEIPHFCEPAGPRPGLCFFEGGWQAVSMCDNVLYQISEDPVSPSAEEWKKEAYKAYVARWAGPRGGGGRTPKAGRQNRNLVGSQPR